MRKVLLASIALAMVLVPASAAQAKKKKYSPATSSGQVNGNRHDDNRPPPPGDKRTNEGAQGRINATEDAARDADSPQFERRP